MLRSWRRPSRAQTWGLLALLVLAGGGASTGALVVSSARARTTALESRLAELQRELDTTRVAIAAAAGHRRDATEMERDLELVRQRLPAAREIPPLYRALYEAAAETGLDVGLFQPGEPRTHTYYVEIPLAVTAQGTYHRLGRFLERIAGLPTLVTVERLKMTAVERPPMSLRAEMVLATYVYRPAAPASPK